MCGKSRLGLITIVIGGLLMAAQAPAYTIYAGLTLDVHQDIPDGSLPEGRLPNDFHVEGLICTAYGTPPQLANSLNDIFPHFNYTFNKLNPNDPDDCWYWFTADWWLDQGDMGIPYCQIVHLGLLFLIEDENTIIDLSGWWTLDGEPVGQVYGGYRNQGFVPVLGFDVTSTPDGQIARIGGGVFPPIDVIEPIPGPGPVPIPIEIIELDLLTLSPSELPDNWFGELYEGGAQEGWDWIPVVNGDGDDVNPGNPVNIPPDSFFDVFFDIEIGGGQYTPSVPVTIDPSDILIIRTRRTFFNNAGVPEPNGGLWEWHIHEAQGAEACCLPDGTCQNLAPEDCVGMGGFPMGMGTNCDNVECPQPEEQACCLPDGTCQVLFVDDCLGHGGTPMGTSDCNGVDCPEFGDFRFEFSLDIGSDSEMSDPFRDGDEGFDPGDVYWWQGPPVNFPGRDGFKDDRSIFSFDPMPDPPDAGYTTSVPVGEGNIEYYWEYFDLDGHDQLAVDIQELQWIPQSHPLEYPIPQFDSPCIYKAEFLMISFDDDMGPGWPAFDVPVTAPSPAGVSSYGSSPGQDEIMGVTLMTAGPPPHPIVNVYPIADEITVHQSLMPNPDGMEENDDDVDSLDIVHSQEECPYWYFSADHEAHLGLDPGGIYQVTSAGPVQIIDESIHLGIPEVTDIDAFEFVWLEHPQEPGMLFLALLFSVDDDDPLTPWDESGGMAPNIVYASFMTGWSFPVMEGELWDDIDGLTAWEQPLEPQPPVGACCLANCGCAVMTQVDCINNGGSWSGPGTDCSDLNGDGIADACFTCIGDLNCDGSVDLSDLAQLLSNYGQAAGMSFQQGDMDGDGDVDLSDLAALLANYGGC